VEVVEVMAMVVVVEVAARTATAAGPLEAGRVGAMTLAVRCVRSAMVLAAVLVAAGGHAATVHVSAAVAMALEMADHRRLSISWPHARLRSSRGTIARADRCAQWC
jgi:hypothetical protein